MTPMNELCSATGFAGTPPSSLTYDSVLAILEATQSDIDHQGRLWFLRKPGGVQLEYGPELRRLVGPD